MSTWTAVARSADVGATPVPVTAGGRSWVAVRLDGEVAVLAARCPHRLVPLTAARTSDGVLECAYHGWRFDRGGTCTLVPSAPAGSTPPPRASLATPPGVRETDGWVWVDTGGAAVRAEQEHGAGVFGNDHPSLVHAWHPVARLDELPDGATLGVRLLGRTWTLARGAEAVTAEPAPHGVRIRFGLVWLAPAEPRDHPLEVAEDGDPAFVVGWLPTARTSAPAALLADNFLDVAHFPFVHAATIGATESGEVPAADVLPEPGGFASVQEQLFSNPEDPGVVAGTRPLQQRRRATYSYRAPFQLLLRLEELDAGAVKTILFVLQPEDVASTRIHTCMLLHGIGGVPQPDAATVAAELAFEELVLGEDLALQEVMDSPGLPLHTRAEVHVRADRLGVALRRALATFASAGAADPG